MQSQEAFLEGLGGEVVEALVVVVVLVDDFGMGVGHPEELLEVVAVFGRRSAEGFAADGQLPKKLGHDKGSTGVASDGLFEAALAKGHDDMGADLIGVPPGKKFHMGYSGDTCEGLTPEALSLKGIQVS
jgi:hypothetical protein